MQALLSVDSRKAIPLSKETGIIEADRALALDQIRHQPAPGVMVGLPQANFALQIFKINADIIALYRAVFSHGETETPTHPDMTQGHPREELAIESEQQPRLLQLQIPTNHLFVPSISPAQQAQGFDSSVVRKISVQEAHNPGSTSPADFQNTPSKNSRTDFSQINASMRAQPISSMQALSQAPLPSALQSQQIAMTRQDMERQQCEAQQQQYEQRVRLAMQMQMQQSQTQYIQTPNPTLSATSPHTVQGSFPNPYLTSSRQPQINQYAPNQQTPSQQYPSQQSPIAAPNTLKDQAALLAFHQDQQLKELKRLHRLQRQQMLGQSGHVNMQQPSEITLQNAEHTHYWQQSQQGQQGQHSQPAQLWHHPIQQHLQQLVHQSSQARQAHPTAPPQSGPQDWQSQRLQQLQNVSPVPVQYSAQSVQRPLLSQQIQQSSGLTHTRDANGNDYAHQSLMYQNLHDPHKQNQAHHKQRANQVDIGTQHSRTPILGQTWKPMQLAAQAMISADPLTGNAAPGRSSVPQTTPPAPALLPLRAPNPALHNHFAAELQPGVRSREQFVSDAAVVDSSTTQPQNEVSYPQLQPEPQPVQGQVLQSSTDGALLSENGTVSQPQHRRPSQAARQGQLSIVPPVGTTIRRNEYPYFPTELRAVQMSLLQLDRRDPSQVIIDRVTKKHIPPKAEFPLFYQFIQRMAVGPKPTPMSKTMHTLQFSVTKMEHSLRSYKTTPEDQLLPIETLFDGSLDYRVRCCVAAPSKKTMTESEWAISDTRWPLNIFIQVNGTPVSVRRKSHNGKDLSVAITELIREGVNRLEVAIPEESHKSGPRPNFFFGVEMIETAHRHRIIQNIEEFGVRDASATIGEINARLQKAVPADDEFAVLQDSISVDLADPFSMKTCQVPVRGEQCQHIECFDLINWLNTRPCGKSLSICQHIFDCQCPQAHRPTLPYKWRCPICFKDARPSSLRIEKFLMNVRSELKKSDKLGKVKSILVGLDGKWDSFAIAKDDAESSGELVSGKRKTDDQTAKQPPQKLTRTDSDLVVKASSPQAATAAQPSRVVDIIEIQD
ncbi:hypothetical protein SEPCBS119000_005671 [Sporothrix epigloea]|uniref:SP-RING-type domain-containing protein n=1 Tax=Sporothrix epigloea TaxID=1892477 RepID=A0ABP0DZZ8_9PEZI